MPTYEFECKNAEPFSLFTTVSGRLTAVCPSCQSGISTAIHRCILYKKEVPVVIVLEFRHRGVQEAAVEDVPAAKF